MQDERELTTIVTRGFESVSIQLKDWDDKVSRIRENMIRVESDVKNMTATLNRLEGEINRSENESLKVKVANLESAIKDLKDKQEASALWLRGLLVSVIFLLIGFLFNFIMLRFK